jgi:hypothetical protein
MYDLGTLHIERLIVHEVPLPTTSGQGGPILSEVESTLTPDLRNYFSERIKDSLLHAPYQVAFSSASSSPAPHVVHDQLDTKKKSFVAASQELAQHLYSSQTRANTGGLLVVAKGTVVNRPCYGILKLEKEEGIRAHQEERQGKLTFNLEHLRDLFLSEKTRVFKVGLFAWMGTKPTDIEAYVSDNQRAYVPRTEVADFFLRKFLGCELKQAPEIVTSRFLDATQAFINEAVPDAAQKAQYNIALHAELQSQSPTVSPQQFAQNSLATEHRQPYLERLSTEGLDFQFDKDTALVESRLRRLQVDFESGIALLATPEVLDLRVHMETNDNGDTHVEFTDRVKQVRGKR